MGNSGGHRYAIEGRRRLGRCVGTVLIGYVGIRVIRPSVGPSDGLTAGRQQQS
jgi:hypothetical protein